MQLRKLLLALMAGPGLLLGLAISASPVSADAAPSHVALIVETAPGSVSTACVGWHSGMSGLDVLTGGATAVIGQRPPYVGFVLSINGVGSNSPTTSTYWAYYRGNGTSSTTYSGTGAGSTEPAAGSVEEWAYFAGSTYPPAQMTYASICHDAATPTTAPTTHPRPTTTAPRRTTPPPTTAARTTVPHTTVPTHTVAPVTTAATTTATSHPVTTASHSTSARTTTSAVASPSAPASSPASSSVSSSATPSSASPSLSSTASLAELAAPASSGGGGSPTGLIVAGLAVVVIGAFAGWRILARRRS